MKKQSKKLCIFLIAFLFAVTPYAFDFTSGTWVASTALAKSDNGNGGGNGNGNGNGNGGGHGNGHGNSSAEVSDNQTQGQAHEHSHGLGLGLEKQTNKKGLDEINAKGSIASKLGRLNAAHASATARANAAPHSAVGRIAAYETAVYERQAAQTQLEALLEANAPAEQIAGAQAAVEKAAQLEVETLSAAANKNIDKGVVEAVNELLGIETVDEGMQETPDEPGEATI